MNEMIYNYFGIAGYLIIPIILGVFISFSSELIFRLTPSWFRLGYSFVVVTLITISSAFLLMKIFTNYYSGFYELIFAYTFNIGFAGLFYMIGGRALVKPLISLLVSKLKNLLKKYNLPYAGGDEYEV